VAGDLGVKIPETSLLRSITDVDPYRATSAEWVFKPVYSRFAAHTLVGPTAEELGTIEPTPENPWVAQQLISGEEYSCFGIGRSGRLRAFSSYQCPYRLGKGSGIYYVNRSHRTPELREFITRFVARFRFTGALAFDLIKDSGGEFWAIECNPRTTAGIDLFADYQCIDEVVTDASDEPADVLVAAYGVPRMVSVAMRLYAAPKALRQRRLRQWLRDFRDGEDLVFSWRDPMPELSRVLGIRLLGVLFDAIRKKRGLLSATTSDIDWSDPAFGQSFVSNERLADDLARRLPVESI